MKRFFASGMKSTIRIWQRPKRVYYKLTAMLLVISVSLGCMPVLSGHQVMAEPTAIIYNTSPAECALLNAKTYQNISFYNNLVKAVSEYNVAASMFGLDYNTSYYRPSVNSIFYMGYSTDLGRVNWPVLNAIREKGDLKMSYRVTMQNDYHFSFKHPVYLKMLAYQYSWLMQTYDDLFYHTSTNLETGVYSYGDYDFKTVNNYSPAS